MAMAILLDELVLACRQACRTPLITLAAIVASMAVTGVQQAPRSDQATRQRDLDRRGAHAMGFDQETTIHHFLLYQDGGAIDVSVKVASDTTNRDAIRQHLPHLAMQFEQGRFDLPHFIHATDVPGTAVLTRLRDRISYKYDPTAGGGRVDIRTTDPEALEALHAFLRFQITDHKTGDSLEVKAR
jgi:hypothetical protein